MEKGIIFLVEETPYGFQAKALGHAIYTEADTFEKLKSMVLDAVQCHFEPPERNVPACPAAHGQRGGR